MSTPAVSSRAREMRIRFVLGPLMIAGIAGIWLLDASAVVARRGLLSATVLGLLAVAGAYEYGTMMRSAGHPIASALLIAYTSALCATAPFFGWQVIDRELYPLVLGTLLLLLPIALRALLTRERMARGLEEQGATMLGFLWIAWPMFLAQGIALRHLPSLLFVILVAKGGDIGAYLVGVAIGKHKLIPHVSAGKTVEGALGGLVTSVVIAVFARPLLEPEVVLGLTAAIGIGVMLNLLTQTGDLAESLLKRRCGAKDSSSLLPAHGGILDLVDSLLFAFPAYFLILTITTGSD